MGQTSSTESARDAVDDIATAATGTPSQPGQEEGIKLYKYLEKGGWQLETSYATPKWLDANEDREGPPQYHLVIDEGDINFFVGTSFEFMGDPNSRRITFQLEESVWTLRFPTTAAFNTFMSQLNDKQFQNIYGVENDATSRAKCLGEDYADTFFAEPSDTDKAAEPMDMDANDEPEGPTPEELQQKESMTRGGDPILGMVMGATENSYLMRGNKFEVLRNIVGGVEDKKLSFELTPQKGAPLTPSKVLLSRQERHMNMLTPTRNSALVDVDVETQQVVATWTFKKDDVEIPMIDITPDCKSAPLEDRSTFLGLDANRLVRWDMRDAKGAVQQSPVVSYTGGKDYARGTGFTCMATSGDGFVAVGSKDGKIRLYSSTSLTQAKTSVPGLGAPITAIDVTYDGKWVVATTDRYLMVVKTTFTDDKGRESTGFKAKAGKHLTTPRLLRLRPEHVHKTKQAPLQKGKFTWVTQQGVTERWVVASVANNTVVWNFRTVKTSTSESVSLGGLPTNTNYHLIPKGEKVVESAFMHDNFRGVQDALIIATPHSVFSAASN